VAHQDSFNAMAAFVAAAELGSFTRAAAAVGATPSAISKLISRLERRLGALLIHRSTRRMTLTGNGQAYYARARAILDEVRAVEREVASQHDAPSGLVRITAPQLYGEVCVVPALLALQQRLPQVQLDLELTDQVTDFFSQPIAIRFGARPPPFAVARRVGDDRRVLCASPGYLKQRAAPRRPDELRDHACLVFTGRKDGDTWRLRSRARSGRIVPVGIAGPLRINNTRSLYRAALDGHGIANLPHYLVADDLAAGRLRAVLDELMPSERSLWVVYVASRFVPLRISEVARQLVAALREP
jgi:LysR family transcriptional regulator, transcriptional activator for dmlA